MAGRSRGPAGSTNDRRPPRTSGSQGEESLDGSRSHARPPRSAGAEAGECHARSVGSSARTRLAPSLVATRRLGGSRSRSRGAPHRCTHPGRVVGAAARGTCGAGEGRGGRWAWACRDHSEATPAPTTQVTILYINPLTMLAESVSAASAGAERCRRGRQARPERAHLQPRHTGGSCLSR